jgi:hypothetical protein
VKQSHILLRLGAAVSSVLLAGGFVAFRAGAFNSVIPSSAQPSDPASGLPVGETALDGASSDTFRFEGRLNGTFSPIMSSSKSIIIGSNIYDVEIGPYSKPSAPPPAPPQQNPPASTLTKPTIMLGPKAGIIDLPPDLPYQPPGTEPPASSKPNKTAP